METKLISVVVETKLYDRVKSYCVKRGIKVKKFIPDALRERLNKGEDDGK